jgi:hypothetical protein
MTSQFPRRIELTFTGDDGTSIGCATVKFHSELKPRTIDISYKGNVPEELRIYFADMIERCFGDGFSVSYTSEPADF